MNEYKESERALRYSFRRPERGRPYSRCPRCRAQIHADVARNASTIQVLMQLKVKLAKHITEVHGGDE